MFQQKVASIFPRDPMLLHGLIRVQLPGMTLIECNYSAAVDEVINIVIYTWPVYCVECLSLVLSYACMILVEVL